jgi:hypothetical protein
MVDLGIPNDLCDMYLQLASSEEKLKYGGTPKSEKEIQSIIDRFRQFLEQGSAE